MTSWKWMIFRRNRQRPHLIEDDRPNPNRRRNNRDRNRVTEDEDQESSPATASDSEEVAYPVDEVNDEDRPSVSLK